MDINPPDAIQLSRVISEATAPAFVLGAVAGFVSILLGRMTAVVERIRQLNEIADDETARAHLKADIPRLRRRLNLLNGATRLALASGVCTALLLVVGFGSAFLRLQHVYGAGILHCRCLAGRLALQVRPGGEDRHQRGRSLPMSTPPRHWRSYGNDPLPLVTPGNDPFPY